MESKNWFPLYISLIFTRSHKEQYRVNHVTIAGRTLIEKFIRKHANARPPLIAWLDEAENAEWKTSQEIKDRYRSADFLSGNRVRDRVDANIPFMVEWRYPTTADFLNATVAFRAPVFLGRKV